VSRDKGWECRQVGGISYSPDGHELALSVSDGTMHVWRDCDPDRHAQYICEDGYSTPPAWSPDGSLLAGGHRRAVSIWKSTGVLQDRFSIGKKAEEVTAIAWSHDGKYLACADLAGKVVVWNVCDRHISAVHNNRMCIIKLWAWSPNDRQLAFSVAPSLEPSSCVNVLWNWIEDKIIEIGEQRTVTNAMLYVLHGHCLIAGNRDHSIQLLDAETGEIVASAFCLSPVRALLCPDSGQMFMAADNGALAGNRPIPYHFEIAGRIERIQDHRMSP
jgi:WD40 repeat protein